MDKIFSPVGLYDFFSHFTPGLMFISTVGFLFNLHKDLINEDNAFKISFIIVSIFVLSYISGRIMKFIFEIIMKCTIFRNIYYRVYDKDKKASEKKLFKEKGLEIFIDDEIIVDEVYCKYYKNNYLYYDRYDNKPYEKRMIIEQAATILKQQKIEGDFIMYYHLKYFYQLMSIACIIIGILYLFYNFENSFFLSNQPINIIVFNLTLYWYWFLGSLLVIVLVIEVALFMCRFFRKPGNINQNPKDRNKMYIIVNNVYIIILILLIMLLLFNTLCPKQLILLLTLPFSLLFREMFIFTYKLYLDDVIKNFYIYKS